MSEVVYLEDDPQLRDMMGMVFARAGIEAKHFPDVQQAQQWDGWGSVDVAFVDWNLPIDNGGVLARWLKDEHPHVRRILVTALPDYVGVADESLFERTLRKPYPTSALVRIARG